MIQVIGRIAHLLEKLSLENDLSLAQLADSAQLNHGTACNLLRSLIEIGWLVKDARGQYRLSDAFRQLGNKPQWAAPIQQQLEQKTQELSQRIHESVVISTIYYSKVVIMALAQYQHTLMINDERLYTRLSLYTSVSGEMLCARLPREIRQGFYKFVPPNAKDLKDDGGTIEGYEKKMERLAASPHNISVNESLGIKSWALPIFDQQHAICACLGLSIPLARFSPARDAVLLRDLHETADSLTRWIIHNNYHTTDFLHLPSNLRIR